MTDDLSDDLPANRFFRDPLPRRDFPEGRHAGRGTPTSSSTSA